jgi:Domain of unknown function (DUF3127)
MNGIFSYLHCSKRIKQLPQMALELIGKLVKTMPEVTGQSQKGPWSKQDFVIETVDGQYAKKICLTAWGDKAADLKQYAPGDTLKVSFNLESREYNDRWYTEARAWRIEAGEEGAIDSAPAPRPASSAPRSAPAQSRPAAPPASNGPATTPFNMTFEDETNDLPF